MSRLRKNKTATTGFSMRKGSPLGIRIFDRLKQNMQNAQNAAKASTVTQAAKDGANTDDEIASDTDYSRGEVDAFFQRKKLAEEQEQATARDERQQAEDEALEPEVVKSKGEVKQDFKDAKSECKAKHGGRKLFGNKSLRNCIQAARKTKKGGKRKARKTKKCAKLERKGKTGKNYYMKNCL
tara:strand:- start:2025 stop:2570 length:546 start_codon:yes stop_codon:yes gene_type:complete